MSKLKEEELLDEFEKCFGHHPSSIRNEQAYQQIKEMIQKSRKDEQLDIQFIKLMEEAKRLGVGEEEFIDNVLKKYKQKPGVTEEWIEEKAEELLIKANISIHTPEAMKQQLKILKDFIHSLIEEIHGRK